MCGIAGLIQQHENVRQQDLQLLANTIHHRGPDNTGMYIEGRAGLTSTRLSILDLSEAANMPLQSEDGQVIVVFNGEIYNFREIRSKLSQKGYVFKTQSDTEVLLNAYLEYGTDCFTHFNGMFGVSVYDRRSRNLILARDRFGKKNVYYCCEDGAFVFASEVKSIVQRRKHNSICLLSVYQHFAFDQCDHTLVEGIRALQPGSFLTFGTDSFRWEETPYFSPLNLLDRDYYRELSGMSYPALKGEFMRLLDESVKYRLISDTPVAVMCSGGVDSSLVSILASRQNQGIEGYLVDTPGYSPYSELKYANIIAQKYNFRLHVVNMGREPYLRELISTIYHNDMPDGHLSSSIAVYHLCRVARENGIKVILSGEAADEVFGGYVHRYRRFLVNRSLSRIAGSVMGLLPGKITEVLTDYPYKGIFYRNSLKDIHPEHFYLMVTRNWQKKKYFDAVSERYRSFGEKNCEIAAMMLYDLNSYLSSILVRNDRATMKASVESRTPFLDIELVKFAVNLPLKHKVTLAHDKKIVKDSLADLINKKFAYRKKIGFGVPGFLHELKLEKLFRDGFVVQSFGKEVLDCRDERFFSKLIQLEIWHKLFIEKASVDELNSRYLDE